MVILLLSATDANGYHSCGSRRAQLLLLFDPSSLRLHHSSALPKINTITELRLRLQFNHHASVFARLVSRVTERKVKLHNCRTLLSVPELTPGGGGSAPRGVVV